MTKNELRMLAPIRIFEGEVKVNRKLIALLMGERDRLVFAIESARFFFEAADRAGVIPPVPNYLRPTELERAASLLTEALAQLDGILHSVTVGEE